MNFEDPTVFFLVSMIHYIVRFLNFAVLVWLFLEIFQQRDSAEKYVVCICILAYLFQFLNWRPPGTPESFTVSVVSRMGFVGVVFYYIMAKREIREMSG